MTLNILVSPAIMSSGKEFLSTGPVQKKSLTPLSFSDNIWMRGGTQSNGYNDYILNKMYSPTSHVLLSPASKFHGGSISFFFTNP